MDDVTASIIIACQTAGAVNSISKLGFALGMLGRKAIEFGQDSIGVFSDLQEETQKFGVVFSGVQNEANKSVQNLIENFGQSELSAKRMLAQTGDLLRGAGFDKNILTYLSSEISKYGADLTSFSNYAGGSEQATFALTKAMLGEQEMAKSLGVFIKYDTKMFKDLEKQALSTGLAIGKNGEVVKARNEIEARALASFYEIVRQKSYVLGDFARNQSSIANQSRTMANRLEGLKATFGEFIDSIVHVGDIKGQIADIFENITKTIKTNMSEWTYFVATFLNIWRSGFELIGRIVGTSFANVWKVISWFGKNFNKMWENSLDIAKAFFQDLAQIIRLPSEAIVKFFHSLGKGIASAIKAGFTGEKIGDAFMKEFASFSDFMIKQIANVGINTDRALAKAGVSQLTLTPVNFSKIFSDVEKGYRLRQQKIDSERNKKFLEPMDTPAAQSGYEPQARKLADKLIDNLPMFKSTSQQGIYANSIEAVRLQSRVATRSPEYELQQKQLALLTQIRNSLNSLAGPTRTAVTTVRA